MFARIAAFGKALLTTTLLLLFGQRLAKIAHSFTQGFHRLRLTVDGFCQIAFAQGPLCTIHGPIGAIQCFACPFARLRALTRQVAALTVQFIPQGALTLRKVTGKVATALTGTLRLIAPLALTGLAALLARLLAGLPIVNVFYDRLGIDRLLETHVQGDGRLPLSVRLG